MKKLLFALYVVLLVGCAGFGVSTVFNDKTECTLYEQYGATVDNSLIASKISNPCKATQLLGTLVKLPAVQWEKTYTEAFNSWADKIEAVVKEGISPKMLQDMVILQISMLNKKAGMTIMILADGILVFKEGEAFSPVDQKMLLALIGYLRDQVHLMEILA